MIFLLFDETSSNFYYYSFDGHQWNETDVYIQNDDRNIVRKMKKSAGPNGNDYYGQTLTVKSSKKER